MVSHYEPAIKHSHPNGGGQIQLLVISLMMRPAWLKTVTRLGLNKFSLMHYGLYRQSHNADAAQTFKAFLQEGQWALK